MSITVANYLDFRSFIINELFGNVLLAYIIILIALTIFLLKIKMDTNEMLNILALFTLFFFAAVSGSIWLTIALLVTGGIVYYNYSRIIQRV